LILNVAGVLYSILSGAVTSISVVFASSRMFCDDVSASESSVTFSEALTVVIVSSASNIKQASKIFLVFIIIHQNI
jgi:hypothetical protein